MMTARTGRPFLDLIKVCGALGSNQVETAGVMRVTLEELQEIVDGRRRVTVRQADRLTAYLHLLWWWHCWREDRDEVEDIHLIRELAYVGRDIWEDLPRGLRKDWAEAHKLLTP